MGVVERRQREKELLREEILDAARDLFAELGYENVSMRKIAEKIEYSPTTIYLYFKDKQELMDSLCEETFGRLCRILESLPQGDPIEALKTGLHAYVRFGLENPNHYRVVFMTNHEHEKKHGDPGMQAFQHLVMCVQNCVNAGRFRAEDPMLISQAIWSAVHGVTSLMICCCGFPWVDRETVISAVIDSAIAGYKR